MRAAAFYGNIPPARYELTARLPGFRSITETVDLSRGGEQQISLVMQVGGLQESVTVTCGAGAAEPRSAGAPLLSSDRRRTTPRLFALAQAAQYRSAWAAKSLRRGRSATSLPTCPAAAAPGGSYVVILEATIGADGSVRIRESRPRTSDAQTGPFVQAAMEVVSQWQVHADAAE